MQYTVSMDDFHELCEGLATLDKCVEKNQFRHRRARHYVSHHDNEVVEEQHHDI